MANRRGEAYWRTLISEYKQSQLTQKAFAVSKGVSLSGLQYWLYRGRRERKAPKAAVRLLPVAIRASAQSTVAPSESKQMTLMFGDAFGLSFEQGTDCEYIARLTWLVLAYAGRC